MHRLSTLDAQFLAAEGGNAGSQYCGVAIYQTDAWDLMNDIRLELAELSGLVSAERSSGQ
jgi:hypothetical protein